MTVVKEQALENPLEPKNVLRWECDNSNDPQGAQLIHNIEDYAIENKARFKKNGSGGL